MIILNAPIPVLITVKPPIVVKYVKVREVNITQLVVGEGVLSNISLGWIDGPSIGYIRLIALDKYDNGVWRVKENDITKCSLISIKQFNSTCVDTCDTSKVVFHIKSTNMLPTIKSNYKIIPIPQLIIYRSLDEFVKINALSILKDYHDRFIAIKTTSMYNYSYEVYLMLSKRSTQYYTLPYPYAKIYARNLGITSFPIVLDFILASIKVKDIVIDKPHNESTDRVQKLALRILEKYKDRPLGIFLNELVSCIRNNTSYTAFPPKTPPGFDLVDYFIYVSRRGSCLHYASTLAVLLRDMGVRARVVLGYMVREVNGKQIIQGVPHLWAEVYIPGIGWLQVDPTPPSAIQEPSPSVIQGVDKQVSEYINISIREALKEYRRALTTTLEGRERPLRLSPYEPIELVGANTSISEGNASIFRRILLSREALISLAAVFVLAIIIGLMVKIPVPVEKNVNTVKELLAEIAGKLGVSIDLEHSTPREIVKILSRVVSEDIDYELKKFLTYYENASYGGRIDELDKALKILSRINRLLRS